MTIEFAGLPGAGKSTHRLELRHRLAAHGWDVVDLRQVWQARPLPGRAGRIAASVLHCRELVSHPTLSLIVLSELRRSAWSFSQKVFLLRRYAIALTKYRQIARLARRRPRTVFVIDEGLLQWPVLLILESATAATLERFARSIPLPGLLFSLAGRPGAAGNALNSAAGSPPFSHQWMRRP